MEYFYNLLFYFAIYSFAGWCGEVVFATVRHGKFVNRGMLHGAYCYLTSRIRIFDTQNTKSE